MKKIFEAVKRYLWNIVRAKDQLLNAYLAGDPRETLSSRMGKAVKRGDCRPCYWVCRALSLIDSRHCERSIDPTVGDLDVWK